MNGVGDRWLELGRQDFRMAELAFNEGIYNQVCFHCQQCVEKSLKGILANQGKTPPRTHSIVDIIGLLPTEYLDDLRDAMSEMDIYYIPTRYPDALPGSLMEGLPGKEEATEAMATAHALLSRLVV